MKIPRITVGADPEMFLQDESGKIISAIGRIGGTKHNPKPFLQPHDGFFLQEDNVLLEYNVPAARSTDQFLDSISMANSAIAVLLKEQGLKPATIASCSMPEDQLCDERAWIFGCDPDYNAWKLAINPRPECSDAAFRSAGGHIHVGLPSGTTNARKVAVCRWLDRIVGLWLMQQDPDKERQKLYGAPGAMRFKSYGMEWRTPSNFWIFQDETFRTVLYEKILNAIEEAYRRGIRGLQEDGFDLGAFKPENMHKWTA